MEEFKVEEKKLNEEIELDEEKKMKDAEEMVKVTRMLQELLDTEISKMIQNELRKNKIERDLAIEIKIDVDF